MTENAKLISQPEIIFSGVFRAGLIFSPRRMQKGTLAGTFLSFEWCANIATGSLTVCERSLRLTAF